MLQYIGCVLKLPLLSALDAGDSLSSVPMPILCENVQFSEDEDEGGHSTIVCVPCPIPGDSEPGHNQICAN